MRIIDCASELRARWESFQTDWHVCHGLWKDTVADHFEREFVEPWEVLRAILEEMDKLEVELRRAEVLARGV